jgi:predicted dehydrogenase
MHDLDLAIWYANQPIRRFHVVCGPYALYSELGTGLPDIAEILLEFEDRCVASVHLDFFQRPRRRQMELIGTDGVIIVEFARWDRCTLSVYDAITGGWEHEEITTERDDMFRAEDREFLEAVAEDQPILCTIEEGLKSLRVASSCQTVYGKE